jgi:sec-independent protein translocase protein TatA
MPIGVPELLIVLVILLVIFGPKRLPHLGRQLGGGLREFKDSVTAKADADDASDEDARPQLTRAEDQRVEPPAAAQPSAAATPVSPASGDDPAAPPRG